MAAHLRSQIRDAAAADLLGLATTGQSVYSGRAYDIGEKKLPALLVYARGEEAELVTAGSAASRSQSRELQLVVEGRAQAREGALDDLLDQIALEVETALVAAADTPGSNLEPLIVRLDLAETRIAVNSDGALPSGNIELGFTVTYASLEADPSLSG